MLNVNKNIIFILECYILIIFVEFFHFGSDLNIIIMLESFICFSILLYLVSLSLQKMFILGVNNITNKYNYIYIFFKNYLNLNINIYSSYFNLITFFSLLILKNLKWNKLFIDNLKKKFLKLFIFSKIKKENSLIFKNKKKVVSLFI